MRFKEAQCSHVLASETEYPDESKKLVANIGRAISLWSCVQLQPLKKSIESTILPDSLANAAPRCDIS